MSDILLIIQIVLVVFIVIAVLLQKSSSIGLGAYSGSNESVFGAKGPASFLTKITFIIGFLFILNTVALGYFFAKEHNKSVVDELIVQTDVAAPTIPNSVAKTDSAPAIATNTTSVDANKSPAQQTVENNSSK